MLRIILGAYIYITMVLGATLTVVNHMDVGIAESGSYIILFRHFNISEQLTRF